MDIDMVPLVPFDDIIGENDEFVSIVDKSHFGMIGIFQSFIACTPRHPIMLYSLQIAFYNIATRRGGVSDIFSITGPNVVGVAMNLFWNIKNTNQRIDKGIYPNGIVLYSMDTDYTYDLQNKKIFKNKFSGYNGGSYGSMISYYRDDPRMGTKKMILYGLILLVLLLFFGYLLFFIYKSKFKSCERSCSI